MTKEEQTLLAIREEMSTIPGHLGFYYKNLTTGYEFGIREEEAAELMTVFFQKLRIELRSRPKWKPKPQE